MNVILQLPPGPAHPTPLPAADARARGRDTVVPANATTASEDVERFQPSEQTRRTEATVFNLECDDFVDCYQLHYPRLVRALELAGASHQVAEDLAQEAFARMLAHWRRVRSGSSPAGYAYRSAFRLLPPRAPAAPPGPAARGASGAESARRGPASIEPGGLKPAAVPGAEGLVTTRLAVAATLSTMPPRQRSCAVLSLVVGLPTSEVAEALHITEGTVRKHLEHARIDLRQALSG